MDAGACRVTVDARAAPDLADWARGPMRTMVSAWYPRWIRETASEGYRPIREIHIRIRDDLKEVPALTRAQVIELNADWVRRERDREALGCLAHELAHVAQDYPPAGPRETAAPGWVVEGIADYLRWFVFEPHSRGAELTPAQLGRARFDDGYRVSANFLDWVVRSRNPGIIRMLNAAAREGRYDDARWKEWTGESLEDLNRAWIDDRRRTAAVRGLGVTSSTAGPANDTARLP